MWKGGKDGWKQDAERMNVKTEELWDSIVHNKSQLQVEMNGGFTRTPYTLLPHD